VLVIPGELCVGARVWLVVVTGAVTFSSVLSLQPNQPGVLHVEVVVVVVSVELVVVVVDVVEVLSSRHPHHPGVLQVEVRVADVLLVLLVVVVMSE